MSRRYPSGYIRPGYNPLEVPDAPTGVSASGGDSSASVSFTAPADIGGAAITAYYAVSNPGQITGTASASPVTVSGLSNGTSYTFTVWALNSYGPSPYSGASGSVTPSSPIAVFGGGLYLGVKTNVIQYVTFAGGGSTSDFGDLSSGAKEVGACGSATRGVFGGGDTTSGLTRAMQYITFATTGNAATFGNLSAANSWYYATSNSVIGLFGNWDGLNVQQITIASTGDATTFGNLTVERYGCGACASPTRAVFAGGYAGTPYNAAINVIDYMAFASAGNATDFGDLTVKRYQLAGCSSSTRGLFAGGQDASRVNTIDYVTIASTGNATDFGDLQVTNTDIAPASSQTIGLFAGGVNSTDAIRKVTIASTGNTTSFGTLSTRGEAVAGCSNVSGGLA